MRKGEEEQGVRILRVTGVILAGSGIALGVCMLVLLLTAFFITSGQISQQLIPHLTAAACVIGSFVGGSVSISRCGQRALPVGAAVGGVLFLLLMTVGVLLFPDMNVENGGGIIFGSCLSGGALAGLLTGGKGRKRTKKAGRRRGAR